MALAPVVWGDDFTSQETSAYSVAAAVTFHASGGRGNRAYISVGNGGLLIAPPAGRGCPLWIMGAAVRMTVSDANPFAAFQDASSNRAVLKQNWHVEVNGVDYGQVPWALPNASFWTHVILRVYFDASAGFFDLRFNERIVWSETGLNTGTSTPIAAGPSVGGIGHSVDFCDYYLQASMDSADQPLGDRAAIWVGPTGAGSHTDWTPNTGDNYAAVDDTPDDGDTTHVASSTPGDIDTYAMGDLPASAVSIDAVIPKFVLAKTDAGSRTVAPVIRIAGTDYEDDADAQPMGTDYEQIYQVYDTSPATSAPWTPTEVNGMELGMKLVS